METEDGDEASLIKAEMLAPTLSFPAWCANLPCLCVGAIMIIERVSSEERALGRHGQAEEKQERAREGGKDCCQLQNCQTG